MKNPQVGEHVSYEDMANPRREGIITEEHSATWGTQYAVTFDDGEITYSDLRQSGWRRVR